MKDEKSNVEKLAGLAYALIATAVLAMGAIIIINVLAYSL